MFWLVLSARRTITIRFEEADPAGVVFYPRAIALAHAAVEDLLRRSALGWDAWFASPHYAAPLRRAAADFFLPMKLSHLLIILMDCSLASVLATASFFRKNTLFKGSQCSLRRGAGRKSPTLGAALGLPPRHPQISKQGQAIKRSFEGSGPARSWP